MMPLAYVYRHYSVLPALRPYVHGFGAWESATPEQAARPSPGEVSREVFHPEDPLVESVIPCNWVMLSFNVGDPFTLGNGKRSERVLERSHVIGPNLGGMKMGMRGHVESLGVMFRAARAAGFLGVPVDELAGRMTPLTDVWGTAGRALEEEIANLPTRALRFQRLETELLRRLRRAPEPDLRFASLADFIARHGGAVRVESLTQASGLSRQHLRRRFRREAGVTTKQFIRLERFQAMMAARYAQPDADWAALAAECGYYDQAHLIAEFKEFTGVSPTEFFRGPFPVQHTQ